MEFLEVGGRLLNVDQIVDTEELPDGDLGVRTTLALHVFSGADADLVRAYVEAHRATTGRHHGHAAAARRA
jgi:hypothetical protein